jgi:outer membrane protein OmpA-like peptidoglycan-associated protein
MRGTTARAGKLLAAAALALPIGLGCASPTPGALVDARSTYAAAERDPVVSRPASVQLYEAKQALDRAEREWDATEDAEETEHLARLASMRAEIARASAEGEAALEEARQLTRERDKAVLAIRTQEADRAVSAAEKARLEAELRAQEAEVARRQAEEAAESERKLREELADLQARETQRGLELTLGDVLFDVDEATLKPGAMQHLERLAAFLRDYPDRSLVVEGHTDSSGSDSYNLELSQRRADSVRGFLLERGVAPERIVSRGYGKAFPVASNDTQAGRQLNRRVDVVILNPGENPASRLR